MMPVPFHLQIYHLDEDSYSYRDNVFCQIPWHPVVLQHLISHTPHFPYTSQNSILLVRKKRSGGRGSTTPLHSGGLCGWSSPATASELMLSVVLLGSGTSTQAGARCCGLCAHGCSGAGLFAALESPCQARAASHVGCWACRTSVCCASRCCCSC